jgi:hypothetical protein
VTFIDFYCFKDTLSMKVVNSHSIVDGKYFDEIKIYGVEKQYNQITLNGDLVNWGLEYQQNNVIFSV